MNRGMFILSKASHWVIAAAFVVSLSSQAFGQAPPGAGPPPIIDPRAEDRSRQISEGRLRSAEMDANAESENQKHVQVAIVNMKADFTRIQVVRNDIARNLIAKKPLDYKLIDEQTGEIHKRASRLNIYMLARAPENKEENSSGDLDKEGLTGALVKLCKLIDSFTENPALKNAGTLDAKGIAKVKDDKARADKDLLGIIKLTENIQKALRP